MKIERNTRKIISNNLKGDCYLLKRIPQDSVGSFLDIGACVGVFSMLARLLHPSMKICCVEPHPTSFQMLQDNISNLKIKSLNVALGHGETYYLKKERSSRVCNTFTPNRSDHSNIEIPSRNLRQLIRAFKLNADDLGIKIDCEGAESTLVRDRRAIKLIRRCKFFAAELHTDGKNVKSNVYSEWVHSKFSDTHDICFTKVSEGHSDIQMIRKDLFLGGLL